MSRKNASAPRARGDSAGVRGWRDGEADETPAEAVEAAGPGELGRTPAEATAAARVGAPTRGNRRLEALLEGLNADPEVRAWWHMAQVQSERLGMSDHSWVHVQIVLNIALRLLRLLVKGGVEPAMVTDHAMRERDAEVVVAAGSLLHDVGMSIHRADHEAFSLFLAERKLRELLADVYEDPAERAVVIAESLHAIIGHRRRGEPYTVEAGVVRVADALDMAHGRTRLPVEAGQMGIHSISAAAIDGVEIAAGERARGPDRDHDEQLRRHLPGRRPARDQAARNAARRPRRGRRRGRGRDREAPADRVPDRRRSALDAGARARRGPRRRRSGPRPRRR